MQTTNRNEELRITLVNGSAAGRDQREQSHEIALSCERILRTLPQWFGIEKALRDYAAMTASEPTFLASYGGGTVGFLTLTQHFERSWEIRCMAVTATHRGQGIGRALVDAAVAWLGNECPCYLHVKTLSPSRPDAAYAATRLFYEAVGFAPFVELRDYWSAENPCLAMVQRVDAKPDCGSAATSA